MSYYEIEAEARADRLTYESEIIESDTHEAYLGIPEWERRGMSFEAYCLEKGYDSEPPF